MIGRQQAGTGPNAGPAVWQYHLPDALGSVRQVVDAQGQVELIRRYDPFGGLESQNGLRLSPYGFAGEEQDTETGHLFLRARTYNPETGRFLQSDPLPGEPNRPQTLHRYAYAQAQQPGQLHRPQRLDAEPVGQPAYLLSGRGPAAKL